ncbi:Spy/CpxP family protein refolding chaperone [Klebsiella pneumoniae]|nr:Spy/CpxP family protein refolding chaperone [Klebsiella pneumoniae]
MKNLRQRSSQSHMFDGISLTEHQRQQDARSYATGPARTASLLMLVNWRQLHRLVTADNFDENAVRAQAEKMANEQIARQVEMAKVRKPNVSPVNAGAASGF